MPQSEAAAQYVKITDAGPDTPWLTLVHGVSQNHRAFDRQVEAFKRDYRLLLIDLPGHGLSSSLPGPYGLAEYAGSIESALIRAGVDKTHYWATHLGAGAGLLLACRAPERITSLILEGPVFPGRPLPAVNEMLARIAATLRDQGIEAAREKWWVEGEWFAVMRDRPDECRAAEHRAIIDDFTGAPWLDSGLASRPIAAIDGALTRLDRPVLIMNGEHDVADFLTVADALLALLPNARHQIINSAGGFPFWEFPQPVNAAARRFLNEVEVLP